MRPRCGAECRALVGGSCEVGGAQRGVEGAAWGSSDFSESSHGIAKSRRAVAGISDVNCGWRQAFVHGIQPIAQEEGKKFGGSFECLYLCTPFEENR